MQSLTGVWTLNQKKSSSQRPLLQALGKPDWQINIIDDADETFILGHCLDKQGVHVVYKKVDIFLRASILKLISWVYPINRIEYEHTIRGDKVRVFHKADQKQLGDCYTLAYWDSDTQSFVIRWFLKDAGGILVSSHTIDDEGNLRVTMTFTNVKGQTCTVFKCYERREMTKAQMDTLCNIDRSLKLTFPHDP